MTKRRAAATLACAMAASSTSMGSFAADAPLRCAIEAPARAVAGQPVWLRFTLTNTGPRALQVLRWNTPWEGRWFAPFVTVERDGKALSYQGPSVKRADPLAEHYLRLDASASTDAEVDLALPFRLGSPGHYRVTPRIRIVDWFDAEADQPPRPREQHAGSALACPAVELNLVVAGSS
jgi:hypothetical protein